MYSEGLIGVINKIDQACTLWINDWDYWLSDYVWMFFSDKMVWVPFYLVLLYMIWKRLGWQRALVVYITIALTFGCCDQFSNLLKDSVGRLRPCYTTRLLSDGLHMLEKRGGFYGFYSSHAANAFGLACSSIIGFRNDKTHTYNAYKLWVLVWAALVGSSRVFVGKHFFGDVLAGTMFGIAFGCTFGYLGRYFINVYLPKINAKKKLATQ